MEVNDRGKRKLTQLMRTNLDKPEVVSGTLTKAHMILPSLNSSASSSRSPSPAETSFKSFEVGEVATRLYRA